MKFFENIKTKTPHERRQHATQIAGVAVAAIFIVWVTTLGVRLAAPAGQSTANSSNSQTQLANVASGMYAPGNTLEVATSSSTGNQY